MANWFSKPISSCVRVNYLILDEEILRTKIKKLSNIIIVNITCTYLASVSSNRFCGSSMENPGDAGSRAVMAATFPDFTFFAAIATKWAPILCNHYYFACYNDFDCICFSKLPRLCPTN